VGASRACRRRPSRAFTFYWTDLTMGQILRRIVKYPITCTYISSPGQSASAKVTFEVVAPSGVSVMAMLQQLRSGCPRPRLLSRSHSDGGSTNHSEPGRRPEIRLQFELPHSRRRINIGAVKQWVSWQEWRFCAIVMQTLARLSIRNLLLITSFFCGNQQVRGRP
jgi:hypothetical protein